VRSASRDHDPFDDSRSLASLRVAVALLILISPELHQAEALSARPELLSFVPEGAGWLAALHLSPSAAHILRFVALSSGALALLGFYSRAALAVLTVSALPLHALSQFSGTVLHDMHLFWFSGLLAVSPCGDVWALDSWGSARTRPALEYAIPAVLCRALLGVVYFFPGLHKLLESGWGWGTAEHVVGQMHAKWFEMARLPWLRVDRYPRLCSLGGHAVPLFELGFLPLTGWRKTRPLAACLGFCFHWATQAFFFIPFVSLWACYVVLVPWGWLLRPRRLRAARAGARARSSSRGAAGCRGGRAAAGTSDISGISWPHSSLASGLLSDVCRAHGGHAAGLAGRGRVAGR